MASQITVDPMVASFLGPFDQISECHITVTNTGSEPVAIKIKTNDNNIFKARPVYAIIDPENHHVFTFRRGPLTEAPMKPNFRYAVVYTTAPMDGTDAKEFWIHKRGTFSEQLEIPVKLQLISPEELDEIQPTPAGGEGEVPVQVAVPEQQEAEAKVEAEMMEDFQQYCAKC